MDPDVKKFGLGRIFMVFASHFTVLLILLFGFIFMIF